MHILALDLATKTGFACGDGDVPALYGTNNYKQTRFVSSDMRFVEFETWLGRFWVATGFDMVAFEEVNHHSGVAAAHMYAGFKTTMASWALRRGIPYRGWGVGEVKKAWTGKGNAKKEDMIAEAVRRGFKPEDDNAADALAVWHIAKNALTA